MIITANNKNFLYCVDTNEKLHPKKFGSNDNKNRIMKIIIILTDDNNDNNNTTRSVG